MCLLLDTYLFIERKFEIKISSLLKADFIFLDSDCFYLLRQKKMDPPKITAP